MATANTQTGERRTPRWLHACAVLTACSAVPLLLLGSEVTVKQVGMVDPVGFREPWHIFLQLERAYRELGFLIEHSHRLFGFLVGICTIVLACGLWRFDTGRWLRWLGFIALGAVSLQGVLGILRVNQNVLMGRELAFIHGCTAQLVFALLCSIVLFTSRSWQEQRPSNAGTTARQLSFWAVGLVYLQIVFGALVRHYNSPLAQRLHFLVAFAVVAALVWLVKALRDDAAPWPELSANLRWLGFFVTLQIMLGVEAWMQKFAGGPLPELRPLTTGQEIVRTGHFIIGSAVFASTVVLALRIQRGLVWSLYFFPALIGRVEGAS
jgi:heme A synthase